MVLMWVHYLIFQLVTEILTVSTRLIISSAATTHKGQQQATTMPEIVDLTESNVFAFEVAGNPKALPRMRYFRNGFYNPAGNNMHAFRMAVRQCLPLTAHGPIFEKGISVTLTVKFYMKRPNSDFVGGQRMAGKLRAALPSTAPIRPDIDNLAKFVLDSCNGVLLLHC